MSKYVIDNTTLTSIGDAIREKEGSSGAIKVSDFATRISAIEGGGSGEGGFMLTGDISHAFDISNTTTYIDELKENLERMYEVIFTKDMKTKDITNFSYAFNGYGSSESYPQITSLPFDINIQDGIYANAYSAFKNQAYLTVLPKINGNISNLQYTFCYLHNANNFEEALANVELSPNLTSLYYSFNSCYSMRSLPKDFFKNCTKINKYTGTFQSCYVLDEIKDLGVYDGEISGTNMFDGYTNYYCHRLKSFTFATNDDGTPIKAKWSGQTITLNNYVGYAYKAASITDYNSGLTTDTQVTNATTYEALKDNDDYWTTAIAFSRYNHDSAVETINSLPDTSEYVASIGVANTIKLKQNSGTSTDGGGVKDITTEELAVAIAKGWTVSFS